MKSLARLLLFAVLVLSARQTQGAVTTLKDLVCAAGRGMINCDSVVVTPDGEVTNVRFEVDGKDGFLILKSGCAQVAPAIYDFLGAMGYFGDHGDAIKAKLIKLYTNKELLAEVNSDICDLIAAKLIMPGSDQVVELSCLGTSDCSTFKATPEGTTSFQLTNRVIKVHYRGMIIGFMVNAELEFDVRTAQVPLGFQTVVKAIPLPGKVDDAIISYINRQALGFVEGKIKKLHNLLVKGEEDPEDVSLWPWSPAQDSLLGYPQAVVPKPLTSREYEADSLKDALCRFMGDEKLCETVKISTTDLNLLEIEMGLAMETSKFLMKSKCEKLLLELLNLTLKNGDWKAALLELTSKPELLKELSSDICALYHAEFPLYDEAGAHKGAATVSCGDPEIPVHCITHQVTPDAVASIQVSDLFVSLPSFYHEDPQSGSYPVKFRTDSNLVFDMKSFEIPPGNGPEFTATPAQNDAGFDERMEIEFYNDTGKPYLELKLRSLGESIEKQRQENSNAKVKNMFEKIFENSNANGGSDEEFSLIPNDFGAEIENMLRYSMGHQVTFDPAKLFFDVLTALRAIPDCVKSAASHPGQCPQECFSDLLNLRDNAELDAGNFKYALEAAHIIGYLTEESKELCVTASGWDWTGAPYPRPAFDIFDVIDLGSKATRCAADLGALIATRNGHCLPGCDAAVKALGRLVTKYIHVTGGKAIEESGKRIEQVCKETRGPCFAAVDGASAKCNGFAGTCLNGECRATKPEHQRVTGPVVAFE